MDTSREIRYYGIIEHAGRPAEVLVVRQGGRQVSQTLTGVTYRTDRDAYADNARKNRALHNAA